MKKIIFIFLGLTILTACQDKQSNTDATWDSFVQKYQARESTTDKDRKTINLNEYNFFIPKKYDETLVKDSKIMEKNLFSEEKLDIQDLPISTILFGGTYDKDNQIFITLMYLTNNTDKKIKDISFEYDLDLTNISGKNEGKFQYNYSRVNNEPIPPKSIVPIFLGTRDVILGSNDDFYKADKLRMEVNNIIIHYLEGTEESTQELP